MSLDYEPKKIVLIVVKNFMQEIIWIPALLDVKIVIQNIRNKEMLKKTRNIESVRKINRDRINFKANNTKLIIISYQKCYAVIFYITDKEIYRYFLDEIKHNTGGQRDG